MYTVNEENGTPCSERENETQVNEKSTEHRTENIYKEREEKFDRDGNRVIENKTNDTGERV